MVPGFDPITKAIANAIGVPRYVVIAGIAGVFGISYGYFGGEYVQLSDWLLFSLCSGTAVVLCAWIDRA